MKKKLEFSNNCLISKNELYSLDIWITVGHRTISDMMATLGDNVTLKNFSSHTVLVYLSHELFVDRNNQKRMALYALDGLTKITILGSPKFFTDAFYVL